MKLRMKTETLGLNTRWEIFPILLLILVMSNQLVSAQSRKAGLTGAAFLKVGVGARAAGLGSAVTALRGDVNQLFWNPAGIVIENQQFAASFNYNKWIADIGHHSAAVVYTWEGVGTVGLGFISFGLSGIAADRDIPIDPGLSSFRIDRNTSATYDYRDIAVQVSFARQVTTQLSLGMTVKSISQSIDGHAAQAVAVDFGSVYSIEILDWMIGARFSNLGGDMKFFDIAYGLPLSFSIGTTIAPINNKTGKLMLAVDAVKPQDGPQYFFSGIEYAYASMIAVRGGWKFNYSGSEDEGTSTRGPVKNTVEGLTLGAGVSTNIDGYAIGLDYAYTQMALVSAGHRVSVQIGLR